MDDESLVDIEQNLSANAFDASVTKPAFLADQLGDTNRQWWAEFLKTRDGETQGVPRIPGTPLARPFRDMSFARRGHDSIEDTMLRSLALDGDLQARRMWEVGTNGTTTNVTHWMRHRHLSKAMNNVTTRSNTFVVYITVKLFEVHEEVVKDNNGNERRYVQIGGAFHPNGDQHDSDMRGMFVIDRSRLEDGYDPESGRFDWENFVMHRLLIEDNLR